MFKLIFAVVSVVVILIAFHFRKSIKAFYIKHKDSTIQRWTNGHYFRLGNQPSFQEDIQAGFSSSTFDLEANVNDLNDTRAGLSEPAKTSIRLLMSTKGLTFDAARLEYTQQHMNDNDIDSLGVPRDPKLIRFDD